MGPYTYRNILTHGSLGVNGWLIDASVLQLNGAIYLLGSGFINGSRQSLVIAQLSNPFTLAGGFSIISSPTLGWEIQGAPVNEVAIALQRNGQTFVIILGRLRGASRYTARIRVSQPTTTGLCTDDRLRNQ